MSRTATATRRSDEYLLSSSHRRRSSGGPLSPLKAIVGQDDNPNQQRNLMIFAILVIFIAIGWYHFMGAQQAGTAAELEAQYRKLNTENKALAQTVASASKKNNQTASVLQKQMKDIQRQLEAINKIKVEIEESQKKSEKDRYNLNADLKKAIDGINAVEKKAAEEGAKAGKKFEDQVQAVKQEISQVSKSVTELMKKDLTSEAEAAKKEVIKAALKEVRASIKTEQGDLVKTAMSAQDQVLEKVRKIILDGLLDELRGILDKQVGDKITQMVAEKYKSSWGWTGSSLPEAQKLEMAVKTVLGRIYDERVGDVDWLLEINGAVVESYSPTFDPRGLKERVTGGFQTPIQLMPSTFLRVDNTLGNFWSVHSGAMLGNCWAMAGRSGDLVIRLKNAVKPKVFVVQHVPQQIAQDKAASALKKFRILGFNTAVQTPPVQNASAAVARQESNVLVEGEYQIGNLAGNADDLMRHIQYFTVDTPRYINKVRLEVLDNHGKEQYTCLYHMRMYGEKEEQEKPAPEDKAKI